jgi:hypothetical protein
MSKAADVEIPTLASNLGDWHSGVLDQASDDHRSNFWRQCDSSRFAVPRIDAAAGRTTPVLLADGCDEGQSPICSAAMSEAKPTKLISLARVKTSF